MPVINNVEQTVIALRLAPYRFGYLLPRDVSISHDSDSRIKSLSMVVEEDAQILDGQTAPAEWPAAGWVENDSYGLLGIGRYIWLSHKTDDGDTPAENYYFVGVITDISTNRNGNTTYKSVKAASLEYLMQQARFQTTYTAQTATQIVTDVWQNFGVVAPLLGLPQYIGTNSTIIEQMDVIYDSVYDVLQSVCRITGWAWRIASTLEPNPGFYFYDPLLETSEALTQPLDLVAHSLQYKTALSGVFNEAYMIGYAYETTRATRNVQAGQCVQELYIANTKYTQGWELSNLSSGKIALDGYSDTFGNYSMEGVFRLDDSFTADVSTTLSATLIFRQPRWVFSADFDSQSTYGRRMAPPIANDGGLNVFAAKQILDQFLLEKSTPRIDIDCGVTKVGFKIDSLSTVTLTAPVFAGDMYVRSVTRTMRRNELDISVSMTNSVGEGAAFARISPDPAVDMARRLARLERSLMNTNSAGGAGAEEVGPIGSLPIVTDNWAWSEESTTNHDDQPIVELSIVVG